MKGFGVAGLDDQGPHRIADLHRRPNDGRQRLLVDAIEARQRAWLGVIDVSQDGADPLEAGAAGRPLYRVVVVVAGVVVATLVEVADVLGEVEEPGSDDVTELFPKGAVPEVVVVEEVVVGGGMVVRWGGMVVDGGGGVVVVGTTTGVSTTPGGGAGRTRM